MLRRSEFPLIVLFTACSPASPPPPVAATPTIVAQPSKPVPSGVRWVFPPQFGTALAELDLGAKGVVQLGAGGQRWWIAKDGKVTQPSDVAPEDLVDARVEGSTLLFVGAQGGVFVASDPVAKLAAKHAGPAVEKAIFRAGQKALLGVEPDGALHRSTDGGATWSATKLPVRAGERVASFAANARGQALVVLRPQRVLASLDDGATWNALATPGIGARSVLRDRSQDLFLRGASKHAKLEVDPKPQLVAPANPIVMLARADAKPQDDDDFEAAPFLAGDRLVAISETRKADKKTVTVAISPLGADPTTTTLLKDVPDRVRVVARGYQREVVVAWTDPDAESSVWRLKRTVDDGKTWEELGDVAHEHARTLALHVGPSWVAVGPACKMVDDESGAIATKQCTPGRVKIGTKGWQDLGIPSALQIYRAVFDAPRNRVLLFATGVGSLSSDSRKIYSGKIDDPNVTAVALDLGPDAPDAVAMDSHGTLRVLRGRELLRFDTSLKRMPSVHLPFFPDAPSLVGDRGLAHSSGNTWETDDGGEHWAKVSSPGWSGSCSTSGCLLGEVVRVGWELPDAKLVLVPSSEHAPEPAKAGTPSSDASKGAPPPVAISCTPKGAWVPTPGELSSVEWSLDGDVRLFAVERKAAGAQIATVVRGAAPPKTISLLAPEPTKAPPGKNGSGPLPMRVRYGSHLDARGYVGARYSFTLGGAKEGKYNPVDVELGWYSAATGKTGKAKLSQVSPFRVGGFSANAMHAIVGGGILFLPYDGAAPLYRVRDDGKVTELARPPLVERIPYKDAIEVGGTMYLFGANEEDVVVASSTDGKTWKTALWSLGSGTSLAVVDGKARLVLAPHVDDGRALRRSLLGLEELGSDPGEPKPVIADGFHIGNQALVACSAKAHAGLRTEVHHRKGDRSVTIEVEQDKGWVEGSTKLSAPITTVGAAHIVRMSDDGSSCIEAVAGASETETLALVAPHDLTHGWLVRSGKSDKGGTEMRPISCTLAK